MKKLLPFFKTFLKSSPLLLLLIACSFANAQTQTMTFDSGPNEPCYTFSNWNSLTSGKININNLANNATISNSIGVWNVVSFEIGTFLGGNTYQVSSNNGDTETFTADAPKTITLNWTGITTLTFTRTGGAGGAFDMDNLVYAQPFSPEINLKGNGVDITDGDTSPNTTDDTDFGITCTAITAITRTFTIQNTGGAALNLTGTPIVAISGSADFSIATQPTANTIAAAGTDLTFEVTYTPNTAGTQTATITIENDDCNEDPYTFDVSGARDPELPILTAQTDFTRNINTAVCTFSNAGTGAIPDGSATDNCSVASYSYVLTGATTGTVSTLINQVFNVGVTTVTWTATDSNGNVSLSDDFTVTVTDNQVPTITAPANVTTNTDAGLCTASGVVLGTATGSDNCGTVTFTNDATPPFAVGTTTVTWTADDGNGNTATATQTVTVTENVAPTIVAPANVTTNTDTGLCTASGVVLGTATGSDNCGTVTFTNDATPPFAVGTTTVTWTADDGNGNTATATQTVTVTDNQVPTITAPANVTTNTDTGLCTASGVVLGTATGSDNCGTVTFTNDATPPFAVGTTTVTWTADDGNGNTATATQTVTVTENVAPTIVAPANVTTNTDTGLCTASGVVLGTATGSDNCGTVTFTNDATPPFAVGTTTVTWTADDGNGNTATATQTVTVTDNQVPTITAPANVTTNTDTGLCTASGVVLGTATGSDNCGTVTFTNDATPPFAVGTTTVTWTADDGNGNTATATQTVTVTENVAPTIVAPANVTTNTDAGLCTASGVVLGTATGSDNCGTVTFTNDATPPFAVGTTTVTWTADDGNGNTATATQTVTVTDNQVPTITAPANVTTNTDAGLCTASGVVLGTATGSDNCGTVTFTNDATPPFAVGTTTVTWTADDGNGNTATATQTVTVTPTREIDVLGNAVSIINGDTSPDIADDTNFGFVFTTSTNIYTIANTGTDAITITSITSDNAEFVVSNIPVSVAAGGTTTFDVTFTPTSIGTQTAIITINNNDCDEGVYDFVVQGRRNPPTPPVPLPPLPIDFTATAVSTTQINLEWDLSNSPNITSYRLYQGSTLIETLPRGATTFEVLGLTPDTFYSFSLIAVNQVGSDTKISNPVFDNDWTFPEDPILGSVSAVCGSGQASVLLTSTAFIYNVYESLTATTPLLQTDGDNNFALPSVSQTTTFYISVLGKDPNNVKESGRIAVTVVVEPTFEATILGESSLVSCESSFVLEAEEVENATYSWIRNGSTVGTGQSFTATFSGDYEVVVQRGVCRFTSDKVNVKLNFAPIVAIQQPNGTRFCDAGTLNATQTNSDATYEWILNGTTVGQGTSIAVSESGTYTLQVIQNGCQASTEINVVVAPTPQTPTLEATESTICPTTETTISIQNAENGVTYQWFRNGSNLRQTGTSISTSVQGNYQVRVISTQNTSCSSISEELSINRFEVLPVYLRVSEDKTSLFVEDVNLSQAEIASVEWYFEGEVNASLGTSFEITPTENGRYSARVTNLNGCIIQTRTVDFTVPQIPVITGEEDLTSDLFKIYPNPSNTGLFNIHFGNLILEDIQITIFDGIGRNIYTTTFKKGEQDFTINLQNNPSGMYMIHFNQNGSTYSKQIIIE